VSDTERHARFLIERLVAMGLEIEIADDQSSGYGRLPLAATPFPTLNEPFTLQSTSFYTLGHNRLKFFQPRAFFDLIAIDVSRCSSPVDLERALRRAWASRVRNLKDARAWLDELGAATTPSGRGTRLALPLSGTDSPPALVQSRTEIQLPSGGPLASAPPTSPASRRYRPLQSLQDSSDLELELSQAIRDAAAEGADSRRPLRKPEAVPPPSEAIEHQPRILLLDDQPAELAVTESTLEVRRLRFDSFRDASRALEAFSQTSYDLVLSGVRMPRVDGLEFATRVRSLPGIDHLPIVLLDNHENSTTAKAARTAGAAAYFVKPLIWSEVGDTLVDLLEHRTQRRFTRYPLRLSIRVSSAEGDFDELSLNVARGGVCLQTRREVFPGSVERYTVTLPKPLRPVEVEGMVMSRTTLPGRANVLAGVCWLRFLKETEPDWIRLIEALARRTNGADRRQPD
jgi:CheY-like chemotaxis protein